MPLTSTWSSIAATQTQTDKPLDITLMDAIRQDIDVLYEWLGGPTYTPSASHDHNGINSKSIVGAAWAHLLTGTTNGTTAIDCFGISTAYTAIAVVVDNFIPGTDNVQAWLQLGTTSGINTDAQYSYHTSQNYSSAASYAANVSGGDTKILLSGGVGNAAVSYGWNGIIWCHNLKSTSIKSVRIDGHAYAPSGHHALNVGTGGYNSTSEFNSLRLSFSAGTITSGLVRVYGLKSS